MPAHALAPEPGWTVLDACAAPGNKTTHAAARVGARGRVLAFDKDPRRLARLVANAQQAGAAGIIKAEVADFLSLDPQEARFAKVRHAAQGPARQDSTARTVTGVGRMHESMDAHVSSCGPRNRQHPPAAILGLPNALALPPGLPVPALS
jgi:putative methyltransferase